MRQMVALPMPERHPEMSTRHFDYQSGPCVLLLFCTLP